MEYLQFRLYNPATTCSPTHLNAIAALFSYEPSHFYGLVDPLRATTQMMSIYEALSNANDTSTASTRAQKAVRQVHQLDWKLDDINRLVFGVALPLREAIRLCQLESPENWPPEAYNLIRRPDLARQNGGKAVETNKINVSRFRLS
jgi:anaphase-promoting complex subunit 1